MLASNNFCKLKPWYFRCYCRRITFGQTTCDIVSIAVLSMESKGTVRSKRDSNGGVKDREIVWRSNIPRAFCMAFLLCPIRGWGRVGESTRRGDANAPLHCPLGHLLHGACATPVRAAAGAWWQGHHGRGGCGSRGKEPNQ